MSDKRTAQIAVRMTEETKNILDEEAKRLKWSTAKLANEILEKWTREAKNDSTKINAFINIEKNENIYIQK